MEFAQTNEQLFPRSFASFCVVALCFDVRGIKYKLTKKKLQVNTNFHARIVHGFINEKQTNISLNKLQ